MKRMHILFLTDNFPPEVNAPASRTFEHCREWVRAGHKVTVVTGVPNFPKGKIYDGYRNWPWQTEWMAGIRIIRVVTYITANTGFGKRILDYQSFMIAATLASPFVWGIDIVIGTSPQFFTVCAAYVISRLKRIPFVFELRDLWPESIRAVGAMQNSIWIDRLEQLALFLYRKSAHIVPVTQSFRRELIRRGVQPAKISVVTNGVNIDHFKPQSRDELLARELGLSGKFVVGYIGTHGMAHGLETLLSAAQRLKGNPAAADVRLVMLGDGANKECLIRRAKKLALNNVVFIDSVAKDQVVRYWSLLDVSIIHLKKSDLFATVIPSKLFECMGMGIPVLHGVPGESAEIVRREDCGRVFEPENVDQLCANIMVLRTSASLRARYSNNGLMAAKRYDRNKLARDMLELLEELVSRQQKSKAVSLYHQ